MTKRDWTGLLVVLGCSAACWPVGRPMWSRAPGARSAPRDGATCLPAARGTAGCSTGSFGGGGALALGLWALLGAPFVIRVAAVALGAVAMANYNVTWGMVGLVLGAWAWISERPRIV